MPAKAIACEVYSRVVGYYRPTSAWNRGKQEEFRDRAMIDLAPALAEEKRLTKVEAGEQVDAIEAAAAVAGEGLGV